VPCAKFGVVEIHSSITLRNRSVHTYNQHFPVDTFALNEFGIAGDRYRLGKKVLRYVKRER